jgi:hypothetical protein
MKKPVINPSERDCPECMGTGFVMVKHLRVPESGFIKSARNALVRAGLPIRIAKIPACCRILESMERNASDWISAPRRTGVRKLFAGSHC